MKEKIQNSNGKSKFKLYIKQCCLVNWNVQKIQKPKICKNKKWKNNVYIKLYGLLQLKIKIYWTARSKRTVKYDW